MTQRKRWIVLLLPVLGVLTVIAWHRWGPLPDSVAARINGEVIPAQTLDVFVAAARRSDANTSRESVLKGLVENRLLADLEEDGHAHGHDAERPGSVGYDAVTRHEQERFRLLRTAFAEPLRKQVTASGISNSLGYLTAPLDLSAETLAPMLDLKQALYTTMTDDQKALAKTHVIARYRFAEGLPEQQLTLWDLYRRQNIQLKVQMHNLNQAFIREAIKQQLTVEYVFHWVEQESGLSPRAIAGVDRCIDDAMERETLLHDMGLMHDIHDDNPALRAEAERVTDDQIAAYYQANRDAFVRVEKVRARHLRVASQEAADRIAETLRAGLSFDEAVRRYSIADDAAQGGELGWIDRDSRNDHWMRALAFVQPQGRTSPPFRSPAGEAEDAVYWEILRVDEKVTGYQPVDSESVRYRAAMALAKEALKARFQTRLAEATAAASLRINEEVL